MCNNPRGLLVCLLFKCSVLCYFFYDLSPKKFFLWFLFALSKPPPHDVPPLIKLCEMAVICKQIIIPVKHSRWAHSLIQDGLHAIRWEFQWLEALRTSTGAFLKFIHTNVKTIKGPLIEWASFYQYIHTFLKYKYDCNFLSTNHNNLSGCAHLFSEDSPLSPTASVSFHESCWNTNDQLAVGHKQGSLVSGSLSIIHESLPVAGRQQNPTSAGSRPVREHHAALYYITTA